MFKKFSVISKCGIVQNLPKVNYGPYVHNLHIQSITNLMHGFNPLLDTTSYDKFRFS